MTIAHLPTPKSNLDPADLARIKEKLMPEYMFEVGSLGADYYHEQWADYLMHIACGTAQPKDGGGVVLKDGERGAAAWASMVLVHDDPALEAMGPDGMTDGHVLMVPVAALKRRVDDPIAAAKWMGDGAVACARVALGMEDAQPGPWTVVARSQLREALAAHPKAERLLEVMPDASAQDAWRYASAMLAYGNSPDGELTGLAKKIKETELDAGWANKEWSNFLVFESDKWQWKKDGALRQGIQTAAGRHAQMLLDLRTTPQKLRMAHLLLSHLGGAHSMKERINFANGVVHHPGCTQEDREVVIEVGSYYHPQNFNNMVEAGWVQHQTQFANHIKGQQWWFAARETGNEALYIPAMAVMVKNLHKLDHAGDKPFTEDYRLTTPTTHLSVKEATQLIGWIRAKLEQTTDLPETAVHDLAQSLPHTACQWISKNPQHAAAMDNRTGENLDLIESLTQHFDNWIEIDGYAEVARRLVSVVAAMPPGHVFDVDTIGWGHLQEAAGADKALWAVYEEAARIDQGFANRALMSLAMDTDATPDLIEYVGGLGGDPMTMVDIQYMDGTAVPERILDVGRRHENLAVRTSFRRLAGQQPEEKQDNIIVLRSPKNSPGGGRP